MLLRLFWRTGCVFGALLIAVLSLWPRVDALSIVPHQDKYGHALAYCCLAFFGLRGFPQNTVAVLLASVFWGVLMECLQHFQPPRTFDLLDMLANTIGVLSAWGLNSYLNKTR